MGRDVTAGVTGHGLAVPLASARVLVAGLGVTGRGVVAALDGRVAALVTADDRDPEADLHDLAAADLGAVDLLVASPGLPPTHPLLVRADEAGVPVWSEVELAWQLRAGRDHGDGAGTPAPWLAITGTDGKTTTVGMLASILASAGLRAPAVGNVGESLALAALDPANDVLAVELSSAQLHFTYSLSALASAVLNVAADHLEWHGSVEAYAAAKGRVFERAQVACVYNAAYPVTERLVREADVVEGARAVGFTLGAPGPGQLGLVEDVLVDRAFHLPADDPARAASAAELGTLADLAHLAGADERVAPHLVADALAAAALARAAGVPASAVRDGLRAFRLGAHRGDRVAVVDGVPYLDDSKASNAHAAGVALAAHTPGTVVWVAGGFSKGARYDDLVERHADRLRAVVLLGTDPAPFADALARHAPQIPVVRVDPGETGTVMSRAVAAAHRLARPGDVVLLAPAAASWDQFRSYVERGELFAGAARALAPAPGEAAGEGTVA